MKFKVIRYTFAVILASLLSLSILFMLLADEYDNIVIKRYDDINLYINGNYNELYDHSYFKSASMGCAEYLPKYDEFEYKENIKGFYVFDGSITVIRTSLSFVLELQFQNVEEYEQFILYEYNRCEYDFDYEFDIRYHGYECYITKSDKITSYYYEQNIPFQFGMLCQNYEKLNIRYVYFRECESSVDKEFSVVFRNTNCEW